MKFFFLKEIPSIGIWYMLSVFNRIQNCCTQEHRRSFVILEYQFQNSHLRADREKKKFARKNFKSIYFIYGLCSEVLSLFLMSLQSMWVVWNSFLIRIAIAQTKKFKWCNFSAVCYVISFLVYSIIINSHTLHSMISSVCYLTNTNILCMYVHTIYAIDASSNRSINTLLFRRVNEDA